MGNLSLQEFLNRSLQQIPSIRRTIANAAHSGKAEIETVGCLLSSVACDAEDLSQLEIAEFAHAVVRSITNDETDAALGSLSKLEASILRSMLEDESFSLDLDDDGSPAITPIPDPPPFVFDASVVVPAGDITGIVVDAEPGTPATIEHEESVAEDSSDDQFEVDSELLDIFAEEAEELLRNIDTSLNSLACDRNDSDSLWEIRRNAHTFKGSAGIVGLKQLSQVAHRVEDLLDRLAETKIPANDRILELLHTSTACLKRLVAGEHSESLIQSIADLDRDFNTILTSLDQPATESIDIVSPVEIASAGEVEPAAAVEDRRPLDREILDSLFGAEAIEALVSKPTPSRSVVRVSLDRLDDLIRIVRDMLISRSVFEQNLKSLERQIDDLHNATRRLQSTSSKLEIDFEASMMGSGSSIMQPGALPGTLPQGSFDELEFDKYTEFHQTTRDLAETTTDAFSINSSLDLLRGGFESVFDEQRRLIDDLQEWLLHVRMVEFASLAPRLQRAVRVTCEEEGKHAELRIVNESLEVDTQILDSLIEPLMHLLKNSVVHGIEDPETRRLMGKPEMGVIEIKVDNNETHIVLRVSDDGRGIAPDAVIEKAIALGEITAEQAAEMSEEEVLDLIFLPGLTTAGKLNLSAGRGVGMSIVKESIAAGRGSISIESTSIEGTRFVIRMPLALAVTKVLLTRISGRNYALPLREITHVTELTDDSFAGIDGKKVDILGKKLPLLQLPAFLGHEPLEPADLLGRTTVIYEAGDRPCAIAVEELLATEEVVIKPLAKPLDKITGILGAAILGNGELVPILDLPALLKKKVDLRRKTPEVPKLLERTISVLIVDDSPSVRHMTSKVIRSAGWEAKTAKDGLDALEQLKTCDDLPVAILSDIEMPRMDGYEFAASLQRSEKFNAIPVIMITSRTAEKHREKALEHGVSQYLTKPYEDRELINSIKVLAGLNT